MKPDPSKSIVERISGDEVSHDNLELKVRPLPNVVYVNEKRKIELTGVPSKVTVHSTDPNDKGRQLEPNPDWLIDYSTSPLLEGRGHLVHTSLYEMTFGEYEKRVSELIPKTTRLEMERLNKEYEEAGMEIQERGMGQEETLHAFKVARSVFGIGRRDLYFSTPTVALAHQFLYVVIGYYRTDEETNLGLSPILESEPIGRKDYELSYIVNGETVKADRVRHPELNNTYRFPFTLKDVGSVELYLPQEDLRGTFKVVGMERRPPIVATILDLR